MRLFLAAAALLAAGSAIAEPLPAPPVRSCRGDACIEFVDLTPRFLAYEAAARDVTDPEQRFALWKQHYAFAAVPPGPRGEAMARQLNERGWPRYAAALPAIRTGGGRMAPQVLDTLVEVAALLELREPVEVRTVAYVGAFEDNAFAYSAGPRYVVNFPVEAEAATLARLQAHELTHVVHLKAGGLSGGWERSIAQTPLAEGLAMRVTQAIRPGLPEAAYVSHRAGWLEEATAKRAQILADVAAALEQRDAAAVSRFTIERGPAGIEREAYAAGWFVVGHLRARGMSFAQIARVPEAEMPVVIRRAIAEMTAG